MHVSEWEDRLRDAFFSKKSVGEHLSPVLVQERSYADWFEDRYRGHALLHSAFEDFFVESLKCAEAATKELGWSGRAKWYPLFFLSFVFAFKGFRAANNLARSGYPFPAYGLIRDLKDRAILFGGVLKGCCSVKEIAGLGESEGGIEDLGRGSADLQSRKKAFDRLKTNWIKVEKKVNNAMFWEVPHLSESDKNLLKIWWDLYSLEVHGARLSMAVEGLPWLAGDAGLSFGPSRNDAMCAAYLNRSSEIAWLYCRMLPFLQPDGDAFGKEWHNRLRVLEESFRVKVLSIRELDKKIGEALSRWVENQYPFNPRSHFPKD